jgi:hypothetical protein
MATTTSKRRRRLSDEERAERRRRDRDRLQHAAEQLLDSEGWQRWVRVRSNAGLARLSVSNQLLVALARPDATFVAGFKAWRKLGYHVRKGEKAIAIIAPLPLKERDKVTGEETGETRLLYKTVFVFDAAQVDAIDDVEQAPLQAPCEPLTGDTHRHLLAPLAQFAGTLGYQVALEAIPGPVEGWCDPSAKRIAVDNQRPANAQVRTLVHELAHALGVTYQQYGRRHAEVIVDTATYVACASAGLDVTGETVPYIAGWGEDDALAAITEFAGLIDTTARRIEEALTRPPSNEPGGASNDTTIDDDAVVGER